MLAMGFSDEEILSLPPQQLLEAVNHVNATSKAAKLSVEFCSDTGEPKALKATVECFLARKGQVPSAELVRSVLKRNLAALLHAVRSLFRYAELLDNVKQVATPVLTASPLH